MTHDQKRLIELLKDNYTLTKNRTLWVCQKDQQIYYPHHRTIKALINRNILKYQDNEHLILNTEYEGFYGHI